MLKLVYLSLNPNLQGTLTPPSPGVEQSHLEPKVALNKPYWLMYPDIEKALWGIYPQVVERMSLIGQDYLDVYAYKPIISKLTKLITNYVVVQDRLIDDAHVSGVIIVTSPVLVVSTNRVRVYNGHDNLGRLYVPYSDVRHDMRMKTCTDRIQVLANY